MYKELVEYIVKSLADNKDSIEVTETVDGERTIVKVFASKEDMGRLIGKDGRIIKAIRNIVRSKAIKENQRVSVDIVDIK